MRMLGADAEGADWRGRADRAVDIAAINPVRPSQEIGIR
jgi:hypothetical protein